jgi:WD40 repeat protein
MWDAETLDPLHVLEGHTAGVTQLAFHPISGLLATSALDETVRIWHLDPITGTRALAPTNDGHRGFGLDAEHLFLKELHGPLTTWDLETGRLVRVSSGPPTNAAGFVNTGETTLIASGARDVHVDDLQSGKSLHVLSHPDVVESLVFGPAGALLASTCDDASLRIWSMTNGEVVQTVADVSRGDIAPAFSPDGRQLAIPGDETIRILDVESGSVRELDGRFGPVAALSFSPDGARLASGTLDNNLRIWDMRTWHPLRVLEGHLRPVSACAFSPDGSRLASLSSDGTLVIWDPEEGTALTELPGKRDGYVGFSADGKRIVTMSGDEVLVWESERESAARLRDGLVLERASRDLLARVVPETSQGEQDPFVVLSRLPADATTLARAREILIAEAPLRAHEYNERAWSIVDPDGSGLGDLDLALVLSSWAVRLEPGDATLRDTLAWALFRKGRMAEALDESRRALELAPVEDKEEYRAYLERIGERASR